MSTRPQPKNNFGKNIAMQIRSYSQDEKSLIAELDDFSIYFNHSNSISKFTKVAFNKVLKKFKKIPGESIITYEQLPKKVVEIANKKSISIFNLALLNPNQESITEKDERQDNINIHKIEEYHQYYKAQLNQVGSLIASGISSEKRVKIQNILESIDHRKLHQKSNQKIKLSFISYTHAGENRKHIWEIASRINQEGIDIRIDQYYNNPGDWKNWMKTKIFDTNHVICFFSHFNQTIKDFPESEKGRGIIFEDKLIDGERYSKPNDNKKFIYILHDNDDAGSDEHLPQWLRHAGHHIYRYPSDLDDIIAFIKDIRLSEKVEPLVT